MRHHFPLATGALHAEQAIHDFSQVNRPGSTAAFGGREQICQQFPLGITQVGNIACPVGIGY